MNSNLYKQAEAALADDEATRKFSQLNGLAFDVAKEVLNKMLDKPELEDEFKNYIFSSERSDDFKAYTAGEEKGYIRGKEEGFAKGLATAVGAVFAAGAALFLVNRNK